MSRFEYLSMVYTEETNQAEISKLPTSNRPEQTWKFTLALWRPGSREAEILADTDWLAAANALGNEGWQLVSHDIKHAMVTSPVLGYFNVSYPLCRMWYFMREVAS